MDRQAVKLALDVQAPLASAAAYKASLIAEIRHKMLHKLGYTKARGREFIVNSLQVEEWSDGLLESANVTELSLMLDRLLAEEEGQALQYISITHDDFWKRAKALGVSHPKALSIVAAFTSSTRDLVTRRPVETINWPAAYEDLERQYGLRAARSEAA